MCIRDSHIALFAALSIISVLFPFNLCSVTCVFSLLDIAINIFPIGYWLLVIGPASPNIEIDIFDSYFFKDAKHNSILSSSQSSMSRSTFNSLDLDSDV